MTKPAICQLAEASVLVPGQTGIRLGFGCVVDLAEQIAPGLTLEQALGPYVANFELVKRDKSKGLARSTPERGDGAAAGKQE